MKRNLIKLALVSLSILFVSSAIAAVNTYTIDPLHSYVQFHINHFGFSNPSGKWLAEGKLMLDEAKPQNSTVNVTIQVANVITGIPELNKHLKGEEFFDIAKFPVATFVSNKINRIGKERALIHGTLTVHGVAKPVTLKAKLNKKGINPLNNKMTVGFTASTSLRRSDFGLKSLLPGLGNEVKLEIEIEGQRLSTP